MGMGETATIIPFRTTGSFLMRKLQRGPVAKELDSSQGSVVEPVVSGQVGKPVHPSGGPEHQVELHDGQQRCKIIEFRWWLPDRNGL